MAAKLILSMDGLVLKEIPLAKDRTSIGRKPHNDIQIDNLAISGEHAVIVTILNDSFLEDLNSTNGTYVNGQSIKKHFLQNNDVIELGKYKLKYVNETRLHAAGADFDKTPLSRPDATRKAPEAAAESRPASPPGQPTPAPATQPAPPTAFIQVLTGANSGKELELTKNLTTLGKPGVQVAVITRRPQGYFITHVEGASFPTVNGDTLDAHPRELHDHDAIELAGVKMEFFFKN